MTSSMVKGYVKTTLGDQYLHFEYGGFTYPEDPTDTANKVKVIVKDYVTGVELSQDNGTGNYGDTLQEILDSVNLTYTVEYAQAGKQSAKKVTTDMITKTTYNPNTTTVQNLKVTYKDKDTNSFTVGDDFDKDFRVTLSNTIVSVAITPPTKTEYLHGEAASTAGATVKITYADGDIQNGDLSKLKITEQDKTTPANMSPAYSEYNTVTQRCAKTLKAVYTEGGKSWDVDYPVEIINDIKSITVHSTNHKTNLMLMYQ